MKVSRFVSNILTNSSRRLSLRYFIKHHHSDSADSASFLPYIFQDDSERTFSMYDNKQRLSSSHCVSLIRGLTERIYGYFTFYVRRAVATRGEQLASIPLVEGRRALRGEKPNRSTLKQGCGGCRDRSEFKNRTGVLWSSQ